jgi:hypothetical protein
MDRNARGKLQLLILTTSALVALGQVGVAAQVGDPGEVLPGVDDPAVSSPAQAPGVPAAPTEDDDSEGHETEDPAPPDHAGGTVADVDVAGEDVAEVGSAESRIEDDGEASGDVTVLAIGGNEIVGAHSSSRGGQAEDSVAPFDPLCEGSGGEICIGLLFARTASSEDSSSSSASSEAALAFACLGGSQEQASADCGGPVGAGVATSSGRTRRDHTTGRTTADQETSAANVCVGPEGRVGGVCSGIGVTLLFAESHSDSGSGAGDGTTTRRSYLAGVDLGGDQALLVEDPTAISIPPGCPVGGSLVCVFLNQGESFTFTGGAGGAQETVHVSLLRGVADGADLALGHAVTADTLARHWPVGATELRAGVRGGRGEREIEAPVAAPAPGELPFTGTDALGLLAAMLVLTAAGLHLVTWERRRVPA